MDVLDFDPSPSQGRCYFFIRQVVRRGCLLLVMGDICFCSLYPL